MKFNPIKRILYTDKGDIIKKLDCPYKVHFSEPVTDAAPVDEHTCHICNGQIIDVKNYQESDLVKLSSNGSNVCFKIDTASPDLRIVYIQ
jgi:hypothetical protein